MVSGVSGSYAVTSSFGGPEVRSWLTHITECVGMEGDLVTMQDIFVFERTGIGEDGRVMGRFRPTGVRPRFSDKMQATGIQLPPALFSTVVEIR